MTYRVASDLPRTAFADRRAKEFLPHLVCSWTLDPASHRLSCAWAAPTDGWDITFSRINARSLPAGIALAMAQA
jgi:hypothetical protein